MQLLLIFLVIAGGMGLSVEAGLLGPLAGQVGDLWATFSIFSVGSALTFLLMLLFGPGRALVLLLTGLAAYRGRTGAHLRRHLNHRRTGYRYRHDDDRHSGRSGMQKPAD